MRIGRSHFVFRTSHLFPISDFRLPISEHLAFNTWGLYIV